MAEIPIEQVCALCGRPLLVRPRVLRRGWGRFHRRCAQIVRTMGAKNPNYRGGRSYHSTRISRERRSRIKARDGFRCVHCGRVGKELDPREGAQLDVHHVVAVRDGGPDEDANLVTLCRRCHNRIEHGRERLIWPQNVSEPAGAEQSGAADHPVGEYTGGDGGGGEKEIPGRVVGGR